jgi:hypothetical protein
MRPEESGDDVAVWLHFEEETNSSHSSAVAS